MKKIGNEGSVRFPRRERFGARPLSSLALPNPRVRLTVAISIALYALLGTPITYAQVCTGDCDRNGRVAVEELVLGLEIAFDKSSIDECRALDVDENESVSVDELIAAVDNALDDCAMCGDGSIDDTEQCDDGNRRANDGCSPACQIEALTGCSGSPSYCVLDIGFLGVVNELDRSVSFVGTPSSPQAKTTAGDPSEVRLPGVPRAVDIAPTGFFAYVTSRSIDDTRDQLIVINTVTRQIVATIDDVGNDPEAVRCTPDGKQVLVTGFGSNTVSIVDTALLDEELTATPKRTTHLAAAELVARGAITEVAVGTAPNSIAISDDSRTSYITNFGSRSVSVIDNPSKAVTGTIDLRFGRIIGLNPNVVALHPDGNRAYVADFSAQAIFIVQTVTREVIGAIPINLRTETRPTGLSFTADGLLFYLTSFNVLPGELFGMITVFDGRTNTIVRSIDLRELGMADTLPASVRVSAGDDSAFVSNFLIEPRDETGTLRALSAGGSLLTIDRASNEVSENLPVGDFPVSLAVAPGTGRGPTRSTPVPGPTPSDAEECGRVLCEQPNACLRDLGCHRNGCPPRDKCCPSEDLDCLACLGGENDGMACTTTRDCPGGECVR